MRRRVVVMVAVVGVAAAGAGRSEPPSVLAAVWNRYDIGLEATTRSLVGVTVHEITHTEASYLIEGSGHEHKVR